MSKRHKTFVRDGIGTTYELSPVGDTASSGWNVRECRGDDCHFRGDISPLPYSFRQCKGLLQRWYPGCEVKKCDH